MGFWCTSPDRWPWGHCWVKEARHRRTHTALGTAVCVCWGSTVLTGPYSQTVQPRMDVWAGPWRRLSAEEYYFKLWCRKRLLGVPWTARKPNPSILKEISPEYSLEGLMLKLKLPYFGHLMQRADSLEKTLMLGNIAGGRRRGQQRMRWLDGITNSMAEFEQTPEVGDGQGSLACYSPWGLRVRHDWATELNCKQHLLKGLSWWPTVPVGTHFIFVFYILLYKHLFIFYHIPSL